MPRGEELSFVQKRFLVQHLACFETPTVAAKAFKEEFGAELARNRVSYYDPTTKAGAALDPELKALFDETRKKFLAELEAIPIANAAVRLATLNRMALLAESRGQIPEVRAVLEQAAKEAGGAFTNKLKLEHTGKDGGPIQVVNAARERVLKRLDDLRERIEGRVDGLAAQAGAGRTPAGVG